MPITAISDTTSTKVRTLVTPCGTRVRTRVNIIVKRYRDALSICGYSSPLKGLVTSVVCNCTTRRSSISFTLVGIKKVHHDLCTNSVAINSVCTISPFSGSLIMLALGNTSMSALISRVTGHNKRNISKLNFSVLSNETCGIGITNTTISSRGVCHITAVSCLS